MYSYTFSDDTCFSIKLLYCFTWNTKLFLILNIFSFLGLQTFLFINSVSPCSDSWIFCHLLATISDKNYEKTLLFGQFCVSTAFPLSTMLRNNEQKLRQAMLRVCNIVSGERGDFNKPFKIPIKFCHWL